MRFRLVEDIEICEDTLQNINNNIINGLQSVNINRITQDRDKKFYIFDTPLGNTFAIPVEEIKHSVSRDYKKLRYAGNGVIVNGEMYDQNNNHLGRAYYGVVSTHNHADFEPNVVQYGKHPVPNGSGISFNTFLNNVRNRVY